MKKLVLGVLLAAGGMILLLVVEAIVARVTVPDDGYVAPSPEPRTFGAGAQPLSYVVLGDSTGTGRGASYERGIAVATARHLADGRRVTLTNLAVSGAKLGDVRDEQLPAAARLAPDVVLVAAGANDVTGLTTTGSVREHFEAIADTLREARRDVAIVVTGAPDMGSVPRFAQPLRTVAGWRTGQLNDAIEEVVRDRRLVLAPIADRTGPIFRDDHSLFAADGFHPDAEGYATWVPVLEEALDRALARG